MNVACFFVVMACFMLSLERVGGFKMKRSWPDFAAFFANNPNCNLDNINMGITYF